jgi:hypothetical protein
MSFLPSRRGRAGPRASTPDRRPPDRSHPLRLAPLEDRTTPTTFTVTNTDDTGTGTGAGLLTIERATTAQQFRVFTSTAPVLTLTGLTIRNGVAPSGSPLGGGPCPRAAPPGVAPCGPRRARSVTSATAEQSRLKTMPPSDDVIESRERPHDDLVFAVAAQQAERPPGSSASRSNRPAAGRLGGCPRRRTRRPGRRLDGAGRPGIRVADRLSVGPAGGFNSGAGPPPAADTELCDGSPGG